MGWQRNHSLGLFLAAIAVVMLLYSFWTWRNTENATIFPKDMPIISKEEIYLREVPSYDAQKALGFKPRRDVQAWPLDYPIDWNADPFNDSNWQFQLHAWRSTDPILSEYFKTHDPAYLREAMAMVLDWHRFYEVNGESAYTWYDMSAGLRAVRLGFLLSVLRRGEVAVDQETEHALVAMAKEHAERLQDDDFIAHNNHGLFQIVGLHILCSVISQSISCKNGQDYAEEKFDELFSEWFTSEGVNKEHSPSYHAFTLKAISNIDPARFSGTEAASLLDVAREIYPWFVLPDGSVAPIGDSTSRGQPLEMAERLQCLTQSACFAVGDFTASGYAIIRSDPRQAQQPSMLFVQGMAYSGNHKHADDLSFLLYDHGRMIFTDSGKYGYKDDDYRQYVTGAAAHNTITLDSHDIRPNDVDFVGTELDPIAIENERFVVTGEVSRPGLFTQQRLIQYKPREILLIRDRLTAEKPGNFVSSLHLARDLRPTIVDQGFDLQLQGGPLIRARLEQGNCTIDAARGSRNPLLGWESVGYLDMQPISVVRAACPETVDEITWIIDLDARRDVAGGS